MVLPPVDDAGQPLQPGQPALPLLVQPDEVFDIAVTPDLGYCLSIRGLARETAQAFRAPFTDPIIQAPPEAVSQGWPVRIESPACPIFTAITVEGIDPTRPSPSWLVQRLRHVGIRSRSLAVDITNYVMMETGQPIHGYDADRLSGQIVVRQAQPGEALTTLDGTKRKLDPTDLVIADDSGAIGLAGVMGGEATELAPDTTRVLIEAANFDAISIGQTAKRHKLPSEASRRYERGVDPAAGFSAALRVADLLVELAGGRRLPGVTVAGAVPAMPSQVVPADLPGRILGHPVSADQVVEILRASGCAVELSAAVDAAVSEAATGAGESVAQPGPRLTVTPPTWRPDLRDPYDYVEEVGRKIGFDVIRPVVPLAPAGRGRTKPQRIRWALNQALPAAGFTEVISFPFSSVADLDRLQVPDGDQRRQLVELANPLAETSPALRTTLLPGLLAAVNRNRSRGLDDLALYEQGLAFFGPIGQAPIPSVDHRPSRVELDQINQALPSQQRHLAAVVTGAWRPAGWAGTAEPAGWQQALAFADQAARTIGLELSRRAATRAPWHPGRCAGLLVGDQVVGYAGELHPSVLASWGLPERVAAVELDLDQLTALAPGAGQLPPLSTFPVAKEDVALVVPNDVPQADVAAALRQGAGELLESLALFDVYTGTPIEPGHKSLAFALRFRAPDRTLTDAEAGAARDAAVAVAVERFGAVPRVA
jgi:phenylalanyl-tRNA synthetase beta chain